MADNPEPSAEALEAACSAIASMEDEPLQWRIARAIDAAVAKERERCAQIADEAKTQAYECKYPDLVFQANGIADAIRSGAKP